MDSLDISKLGGDYQILTELYAGPASRTYLARHLRLNRDVVITAYSAGADRAALTAFAEDVGRLTSLRHPNIIPIIEGRWLGDVFAVVRARVRGSTLQQVVDTEGPMPSAQIDDTLRNVASALAWARGKGIAHRGITPQSLIFQQGSGRPLIAFEPMAAELTDEQTIRTLATVMSGGAAVNVTEYLAILAPGASVATPLSPTMTVLETPHGVPVARDAAVVPVRRGMSFGARVLTAAIVIAALVVAAVLLFQWRASNHPDMANDQRSETTRDAAGDVALTTPAPPTDTEIYPTPRIIEPNAPTTTDAGTPTPYTPNASATPMSNEPAPLATDAPADAPPANSGACASAASSDQHACLMSAILDHDRELNAVYQQLIAALERQAGTSNPDAVRSLRAAEARWIDERDRACRSVGSGPFYARDRAACFAEQSDRRTQELRQMLSSIPPGT